MVKEIIGGEAEKLGFFYQGCDKNRGITMYNFERNRKGFIQTIYVSTISLKGVGRYVRMLFLGCAWGNGNIDAENLLESKYYDEKLPGLKFGNENEFTEILKHLARIIREKGKMAFELKEYPKVEQIEIKL